MSTLGTADGPDWARAADETLAHLVAVLRMDTVNPPGNELAVARYLDGVLRGGGIETHLFEPAPGRAALVARLRGDGSARPVLLLAHMDVVGVERERWSVDPFGGEVHDGYVYGRGAIDDKGMLAVNLQTMLLLRRHVGDAGRPLRRDVVMVATSDEEAGGDWGIGWLLANHPELMRAEFAFNEGGRIRVVDGRPLYAAVQCAEKVSHRVRVEACGPGGHAAIPLHGNAIVRLARALAAIGAHREPLRLTTVTRAFFATLARVWPYAAERRAMADVAAPDLRRQRRGARVLARVPVFDAVLRNGVSVTMLDGGIRGNVIPTEAAALLDVRTLPGQSIDGVVARLARAVDDRLVALRVTSRGIDAPPSEVASPMFEAIAEAIHVLDPRIVAVPYLSTGATDSAYLRQAGIEAYGLLPFPLEQGDEERMHGHDERLPLASLSFGLRLVYLATRQIAASGL